jgi:hypothetical protein
LTASNTAYGGYFTLYPTTGIPPFVSSVNWNDWKAPTTNIPRDVANLVIVPLNTGRMNITIGGNNPDSAADVIIDVIGYLDSSGTPEEGSRIPLSSQLRLYDSRTTEPVYQGSNEKGVLTPGQVRKIKARGALVIPANAKAVIVRITTVDVSGGGFLAMYPGPDYPGNSSVNTTGANQVIGNLAIIELDAEGNFLVKNGHPVNKFGFILDLVGFIT